MPQAGRDARARVFLCCPALVICAERVRAQSLDALGKFACDEDCFVAGNSSCFPPTPSRPQLRNNGDCGSGIDKTTFVCFVRTCSPLPPPRRSTVQHAYLYSNAILMTLHTCSISCGF